MVFSLARYVFICYALGWNTQNFIPYEFKQHGWETAGCQNICKNKKTILKLFKKGQKESELNETWRVFISYFVNLLKKQ